MSEHSYALSVAWTGNRGTGTTGYRDYGRDVTISASGVPDLLASADGAFRGDRGRWNPELLLVAALSECHLLSYLHVAVLNGVVVTGYSDSPIGTMAQEGIGGRFTRVLLRPRVRIADPAQVELATRLHHEAAEACFIRASVNFPVDHDPEVVADGDLRR